MTNIVSAVAGSTVDPTQLYGLPTTGAEDNTTIDQDAFLKLLVAQLRFQDPLDPSSSEEFISTTAQFTTVEQLTKLTAQGEASATANALNTASALVGREITVLDATGLPVSATVQQAQIISDEVILVTELGGVYLNQIIGIGAPDADPQSTTDTTSGDEGAVSEESDTTDTGGAGATDTSGTVTDTASSDGTETAGGAGFESTTADDSASADTQEASA